MSSLVDPKVQGLLEELRGEIERSNADPERPTYIALISLGEPARDSILKIKVGNNGCDGTWEIDENGELVCNTKTRSQRSLGEMA